MEDLEYAPCGGQFDRKDLTRAAELPDDGSHDEARSHSACIQRQVAEEFLAEETLHALSKWP